MSIVVDLVVIMARCGVGFDLSKLAVVVPNLCREMTRIFGGRGQKIEPPVEELCRFCPTLFLTKVLQAGYTNLTNLHQKSKRFTTFAYHSLQL